MKKNYFLILVLFLTAAYSQNDLCADAIEIFPGANCAATTGTFSGAGISAPIPNCASGASQDVWYRFTATEKMNLITLTGTSGVSNGFEVYYGSCNGNIIFCQNTNNATGSGETFRFAGYTIGETYYIRVFNAFSAPTSGTFTICVQSFPAPANDMCADAITITPTSGCVTNTFTFSGSSLDGNSFTSCSPNPSQDIWYKFVAINNMMSINIAGASDVSTAFEVYDGSCSGNMIQCRNSLGQGSGEFLYFNNIVIGATYYVRVVNAYATPSFSSGTICIQTYAAPANDLCTNAITLTPNANCIYTTGTFSGAILDGNLSTSCSPNTTQDVWYKFTATNTTMSVAITGIPEISNAFEIYEGNCAGTMIVCRNINTTNAGESVNYSGFTVGNEYYVRVENVYAFPLSISNFNVCITDTSLGIEGSNDNTIEIYPNPVQDVIQVHNVDNTYNYELFNQLGQVVIKGKLTYKEIDIRDIESGVYLLRISGESGYITKRIIKQ